MITYANKPRDFKVILACNTCSENQLMIFNHKDFLKLQCPKCNSSEISIYLPYQRYRNISSGEVYESYNLAKDKLKKIQHQSLNRYELDQLFKYMHFEDRCFSCDEVIYHRLNFNVKMLNDRSRLCDFFFPNYFSLHLYEVYANQCLECGRKNELLRIRDEILGMKEYEKADIDHHRMLAYEQTLKEGLDSDQPSGIKIEPVNVNLDFDLLDTLKFKAELASLEESYQRAKDDYDTHLRNYNDVWHHE